jgi:hypothetical protein
VFIVLDYGSTDDLIPYLKAYHARDIASGRLVVYQHPAKKWHISHAKNMAARCGLREGADVLVTLDADNFTGPGFSDFLRQSFAEPGVRPGIFLCPDYAYIKSLPHGPGRPQRGYAGRLAVWASTFVKMGGYDEAFSEWGREDICMNFRLQRAGYTMRHIPNHYLNAIPHGADVRFKEYPQAQANETFKVVEELKSRTETVVNFGRWGCGTVTRNFDPTPISLDPLPTRIFGIGFQKTATTSLAKALAILGYDSFHWGEGEAPLIWYEMQGLGRSKTLEQWYALCDNPIPAVYRELDQAYPGSKFILTVRDECDWLRSCRDLWDYAKNPTRRLWDIYPFSHVIHTALYGQREFDPLVMLARYRRHNAEVIEYFKGREDLLVLRQPAWGPLCGFLGLAVPQIAYPVLNRVREDPCT